MNHVDTISLIHEGAATKLLGRQEVPWLQALDRDRSPLAASAGTASGGLLHGVPLRGTADAGTRHPIRPTT
jgi:hypothetical protein